MSMWLYQLNQEHWTPEIFRYEIWENKHWHWDYGKKRGGESPQTGDTIVFFYAPNSGDDPGIYGWAVCERCDAEAKTLYFIPATPTNYLKMHPWWDDDAKAVVDAVRGVMKQATLFDVSEESVAKIRSGIRKWLR